MSLKHGILGLLNTGPMTGYELDRAFKRSLSLFWQAQTSQIYRELTTMEGRGWLSSMRVVQADKPNKKVYSITATGREELLDWLSNPEADINSAMSIRSAFLMRVFFGDELTEAETLIMLYEFREKCRESLESLDEVRDSIQTYGTGVNEPRMKYWQLTAQYGEFQYRASLDWVEQAIAMLARDSEGKDQWDR